MDIISSIEIFQLTDLEEEVQLFVKVGFGQPSSSQLYLGNKLLKGNITSSSEGIKIKKGKELKGKKLILTTAVHDLQPDTDMTSVEVSIQNGETLKDFKAKKFEVKEEGDVVLYTLSIFLF